MKFLAGLLLFLAATASHAAGLAYCSGTTSSVLASGTYQARCSAAWIDLNNSNNGGYFVSLSQLSSYLSGYAPVNDVAALQADLDSANAQILALQEAFNSQEVEVETGFADTMITLAYIGCAVMFALGFVAGQQR